MNELTLLLQRNNADVWRLQDRVRSFTPERQEWYSRHKFTPLSDALQAAGQRPRNLIGSGQDGSGKTTELIDQAMSKYEYLDGRESVTLVFHSLQFAKHQRHMLIDLGIVDADNRRIRFISMGQVPNGALCGCKHVFWDHHAVEISWGHLMSKKIDRYIEGEAMKTMFIQGTYMFEKEDFVWVQRM